MSRVGIGAFVALVAALALIGLGRCSTKPEVQKQVAKTAQAETTAAVAITQTEQGAAVAAVTEETHGKIARIERRTERLVAAILAEEAQPAEPGVVYRDYPDDAFYRGVCASPLYARDARCGVYRSGAEGADPRPGAGALPPH